MPEHFNLPESGWSARSCARPGLKWRTVPEGTGAMCTCCVQARWIWPFWSPRVPCAISLQWEPGQDHRASRWIRPLTWGVHVGAGLRTQRTGRTWKRLPFAISRPNSGSHLVAMALRAAHTVGTIRGRTFHRERPEGCRGRLPSPDTGRSSSGRSTPPSPRWTRRAYCVGGRIRSNWPSFVVVATEAVPGSSMRRRSNAC